MTAVSDTDAGYASETLCTFLIECRDVNWCRLPKGGFAPCPVCAQPGSPFHGMSEAAYQRNPAPPPAQFTGEALRERSVPRRPAGRRLADSPPALTQRDRTGPR